MYAKGSAGSRYGEDAATPSPGKLGGGQDGASIHIPKPRRTGNAIADEDAMSVQGCLEEMVCGLHNKRHHVMPLYLQYQKRLKHEHEESEQEARGGELFDKAFSNLRAIEEEWLMNWLVTRSKNTVTVEKLVKAKKVDMDAIFQLASYALQLPMTIKMPDVLRVKDIAFRAFNSRAHAVGDRLLALGQKPGLFMSNGQIKWALGCYSFTKTENKFVEVVHQNGDRIDISSENISDEYVLEHNWSDWEAQLKRGRFPGLKLNLFFEGTGTGPYRWPQLTNKGKEWGKHCEDIASAWQDERAKLTLGNQQDSEARVGQDEGRAEGEQLSEGAGAGEVSSEGAQGCAYHPLDRQDACAGVIMTGCVG